MKNQIFIMLFFITLLLFGCKKEMKTWENKDFKIALDNYCQFVDSVSYRNNFDYIFVESNIKNDNTEFVIYLCGGSYDFLNEKERIIDFFVYKKYDILLVGDFPNEIVQINKNTHLNIIRDIVKERYPEDYEKYLNDERSVGPLIYDYMNMILIFKGDKLISCKRQYY